MHTENHIQAAGGVDPEALDDQVVEMYHRGVATEEPLTCPSPHPPAQRGPRLPAALRPRMNSFADSGYDLALARLRRG